MSGPDARILDPNEVSWCPHCSSTDDVCECMAAEDCPHCGEFWEHCECDHDLDSEEP